MTPASFPNHQPGRIPPGLMVALGFVSMAASLSTDLYLPAFPALAEHFSVGPSAVQFTLTAFLAGAAFGQLVIGALSDALGRRRTLIAGLAVFALCAVIAPFSGSIEMLIAVRCVQGFAGSAGAVLARAVISDLATPAETGRAFGTLFVMIALGPAIANPLGGWLTELGGWQAPLLSLALLAVAMCLVAGIKIPESLPAERRHRLHPGTLAKNLWKLTRMPAFMGFSLAFGLGYACMMVYISSSSFIAQGIYELTPFGYSLTFALGSLSFMGGAWLSSRISVRWGSAWALRVGQVLQVTAAAASLALALLDAFPLGTYLTMVICVNGATGIIMSTASALAMGQAVGITGAGSALVGFSQFLFGALGTPIGGLFGTGTAVPAFVAMTCFGALAFVAAGVSFRRTRSSN